MKNIIELVNINKYVNDGDNKLQILKDCSLIINEGEMIAILGRSGSGKTTILNILAMIDRKYEGEYYFYGEKISEKTEKETFKLRNENIGYIFQDFQLIDEFSVLQNVEMPLGYRGLGKKERWELSYDAINSVGLKGREHTIVGNLSGGERQRVSIARALAQGPKLILADEPTGNLDINTTNDIMNLLIDLNNKSKITLVIVTHDLKVANMCSKIATLNNGGLDVETE